MSEHLSAEIWIGGRVPRRTARRLCTVIDQQSVALEWGESRFAPERPSDLMGARREVEGRLLLYLCDEEASWGQFDALEAFLVRNEIPFRRHSEGKYEFDPQLVEFRPGRKPIVLSTNHSREPLVSLTVIREAEAELRRTADALRRGDVRGAGANLRRVLTQLRDRLPPKIPPLPTFEVT